MSIWSLLLIVSGILECIALLGTVLMLALTAKKGPSLAVRKAFAAVLPFVAIAFIGLGVASCVNLVNTIEAGRGIGLILPSGDDLNVLLGLFGFLMPVALAMSAQALPMYAGLEAFPRRVLWPLAGVYLIGLVLAGIATGADIEQANWTGIMAGLGMLLMGIVVLVFIGIFLSMIRKRGRLPQRVAQLAPSAETAARTYQKKVASERNAYGPFVALVASAYLWAALGGILLSIDGLEMLLGGAPVFAIDAIRHSLTVGFITLLICGIAPRMIPGFSGGNIATPVLVSATLWLGNIAALLRVGSILAGPLLFGLNLAGYSLGSLLFGLSGPVGLALAICLTVNLWPTLWPRMQAVK
jgi:uncharacterized membrane protein